MVNTQLRPGVLLVDAGNSAVKWGFTSDQDHITLLRESYPENIQDIFFKALWSNEKKPIAVYVSCVANELVWNTIEQACLVLWGVNPVRVVSSQQGLGVTNAYLETTDLGSDRWCAILAANQQADNSACIVIDCGTAITIDVVEPSGQHCGGYILPGLIMMQRSLGMLTANIKLDKDATDQLSLAPAVSTTDCVLSGSHLAAVAAIEFVVMEQQKKYGRVKSCLTGGDASSVSGLLSVKHEVIPELVLLGLALIAADELNAKKRK